MKIANLLLSGLAVAAMGFMATGCNENPNDPGTPGAPGAPRNIQATSMTPTSVGLKWDAPSDTGTITYRVSWRRMTGTSSDSGSTAVSTTSHTVTGLTANTAYTFSVSSVRNSAASTAATINWAGAQRYTTDQNTSTTIRLYEKASASGSGLTIDPAMGGPRNVSVSSSNNTPNSVQLAIYTTDADPNNFEIGPAYAFPEYKNADRFDQATFISDSSYQASSLDTWYSSGTIDQKIPANGNIRAFMLPVAETGTLGQGFYVRTGGANNYHYARILVKKANGRLLQGTAPNRYVELEISYQMTPNLAYAKAAGRTATPGYQASKVYHPVK